jgi:hypothetical protein
MPEDVLFVCEGLIMNIWDDEWGRAPEADHGSSTHRVDDRQGAVVHPRRRGGVVSEREDTNVIELLRDPQIVAWLDERRPEPEETDDDEQPPLHAA